MAKSGLKRPKSKTRTLEEDGLHGNHVQPKRVRWDVASDAVDDSSHEEEQGRDLDISLSDKVFEFFSHCLIYFLRRSWRYSVSSMRFPFSLFIIVTVH